MIGPNDLVEAFARNVSIIKMQADGLTHEDSLIPLPFRGNCLNWVIGHIAVSRDTILEVLGQPPISGAEGLRYKRGSEVLAQADEATLPLEELLAWLDRTQECLAATLEQMDEAALSREIPAGERTATVGQRAFFFYFHESYHVGQTEMLRQLAGKNDKVI
jgi:uncharacterized damage-inducible protein DinB